MYWEQFAAIVRSEMLNPCVEDDCCNEAVDGYFCEIHIALYRTRAQQLSRTCWEEGAIESVRVDFEDEAPTRPMTVPHRGEL